MTVLLDRLFPAAVPAATATVAELSDVTVVRDGATLLDRIDWTLRDGERWVVLGANGAGKSTLLSVLSGAVRPTRGSVELLGEALADADLDDLLPRVGWSSAALADSLPGDERAEDIVLSALHGTTRRSEPVDARDAARAAALLTALGCRRLMGRAYGSLSEGERKRVQLARALVTDPELLCLDEPAAGLDLGGREALLRMLARLAADPLAPAQVLVSHHVEEVPVGFTHALLLREGRVVVAGPIEATLSSASLSRTFGLPLRLVASDGRWTARAALGTPA